jgi:hypothetical protein
MNSILFCFSEYKLHLRKAGYPVFISNASINFCDLFLLCSWGISYKFLPWMDIVCVLMKYC